MVGSPSRSPGSTDGTCLAKPKSQSRATWPSWFRRMFSGCNHQSYTGVVHGLTTHTTARSHEGGCIKERGLALFFGHEDQTTNIPRNGGYDLHFAVGKRVVDTCSRGVSCMWAILVFRQLSPTIVSRDFPTMHSSTTAAILRALCVPVDYTLARIYRRTLAQSERRTLGIYESGCFFLRFSVF